MIHVGRWLIRLLAIATPAEFREAFEGDLNEGFQRRAREDPVRALAWIASECLRTPYITLWTVARRLRRSQEHFAAHGIGRRTMLRWDLKVATRSLCRRPAFTGVAVSTLALSIGAATLIFSVLEGVILRPLPFPSSDRIYRVYGTSEVWRESEQPTLRAAWNQLGVAPDLFDLWPDPHPALEARAAYWPQRTEIRGVGAPRMENGATITAGFFELLGVTPVVGRLPTSNEFRIGAPVLVLGERLWRGDLGSDREVIGRSVTLHGVTHTVIGVAPSNLMLPSPSTRWWAPVGELPDQVRAFPAFQPLIRVSDGTDLDEVTSLLGGVARQLAETDPRHAGTGVRLVSLRDEVVGPVSNGLVLLFAATAVLVLIACVNLTNLVVARAARRRGEIALRIALGADRGGLVSTLLSETLLLSAVGGGLGLFGAAALLDPFVALLGNSIPGFPRADNVDLNGTVLAFTAGLTILTAVVAGTLPAMAASRNAPWEALRGSRRSGTRRNVRRAQRGLLMVETALTLVLLAGAGLLTRAFIEVVGEDTGFEPEQVAFLETSSPRERYPDPTDVERLGTELERRLMRVQGVRAVSRAHVLPGRSPAIANVIRASDAPKEAQAAYAQLGVAPSYFDVMGIALLGGRAFTDADTPASERVVVIGELLANLLFRDRSALGEMVLLGQDMRMEDGRPVADAESAARVVGIVGDVKQSSPLLDADPQYYVPLAQAPQRQQALIMLTEGDPLAVLEASREAVLSIDDQILIEGADALRLAMNVVLAPMRVRMTLFLGLAGLAAFLALIGVYGVVAHVVSDQLREIGVRIALGAAPSTEVRRVVISALMPSALGGVLGVAGALGLARFLEGSLHGVTPLDPLTHGGVFLMLMGMAGVAAWVPARRAAAVDPVVVLKEDH